MASTNIHFIPLFVISMIINLILAAISIILIVKHILIWKIEVYFLIIIVIMPTAWIIRNVLEVYVLLYYSDWVYAHMKDHDLHGQKLAMTLNWSPIVLYLLASIAYVIRWIGYYLNVKSNRISFASNPKSKWFTLILFAFVWILYISLLTIKVIYNTEFSTDLLEYTLAGSYILTSITMLFVILSILKMIKVAFPSIYYKKHKIIKIFWISLAIILFLRGASIILSIAVEDIRTDNLIWKSNLIFFISFYYIETIPPLLINIMLWKNFKESQQERLVDQSTTELVNDSIFTLDNTENSQASVYMEGSSKNLTVLMKKESKLNPSFQEREALLTSTQSRKKRQQLVEIKIYSKTADPNTMVLF